MKHIAYLMLCLSASSDAVNFPVDYVCDYGDKLTVPVLMEATPRTLLKMLMHSVQIVTAMHTKPRLC